MPETNIQNIDLMDKIIRKSMHNMKVVDCAVSCVVCFAPNVETKRQLLYGLDLIKSAMQQTADFHAERKHKLLHSKT